MTYFRDFTAPLWKIFCGNLLMAVTIVLYIAWWTFSFRPNGDGQTVGAGLLMSATLFAGVATIPVLFQGIYSLYREGKGFPVYNKGG